MDTCLSISGFNKAGLEVNRFGFWFLRETFTPLSAASWAFAGRLTNENEFRPPRFCPKAYFVVKMQMHEISRYLSEMSRIRIVFYLNGKKSSLKLIRDDFDLQVIYKDDSSKNAWQHYKNVYVSLLKTISSSFLILSS